MTDSQINRALWAQAKRDYREKHRKATRTYQRNYMKRYRARARQRKPAVNILESVYSLAAGEI